MNDNSDFEKDLIYSKEKDFLEKVDNLYRKVFPDFVEIDRNVGLSQDKAGIDVIITLESGKQLFIDEKKRRKNYRDILLEIHHDEKENKLGYILDPKKKTDFIVYIIEPTSEVFIFSTHLLKKVLIDNFKEWKDEFGVLRTDPQPWISTGIPVPSERIYLAMGKPFILLDTKINLRKLFRNL